jgi:hypothetical protein
MSEVTVNNKLKSVSKRRHNYIFSKADLTRQTFIPRYLDMSLIFNYNFLFHPVAAPVGATYKF